MAVEYKNKTEKSKPKKKKKTPKKPVSGTQGGAEASTTSASQKGKKGFQPGKSGNPKGRPKGSRNKSTLLLEALLDEQSAEVTRKCVDLALAGDSSALRLIMERIIPPRKYRTIEIDLPVIKNVDDLQIAQDVVMQAASSGELTLDEANQLFVLLEARRKAMETQNLATRLQKIEEHLEAEE
jgi:hypothetical protein